MTGARLAAVLSFFLLGACAAPAPRRKSPPQHTDPVLALFQAAARGDEAGVDALLARGVAVDAPDRFGRTALYAAAYEGRLGVVQDLLARGANANARSVKGDTPLHAAAETGRGEVIKALLAHRADPNAKTGIGDTPLVLALMGDKTEAAELLRAAGGLGEAPSGRVGLKLESRNGAFVIAEVIPNSPAARAGLMKGDELVSVNGRPLSGLDEAAAIARLRGPKGETVRFELRRPGAAEPTEISLIRDAVAGAAPQGEETPWWRQ